MTYLVLDSLIVRKYFYESLKKDSFDGGKDRYFVTNFDALRLQIF